MKIHVIIDFVCVCVFMEKYILFQVIRTRLRGILLNVSGMLTNVYNWLCRQGEELIWEWK